jgi:hypothetical protein
LPGDATSWKTTGPRRFASIVIHIEMVPLEVQPVSKPSPPCVRDFAENITTPLWRRGTHTFADASSTFVPTGAE